MAIGLLKWRGLVDALRHQFINPTEELIDTILVAQSQVKDGFLATMGRYYE